MPQTHLVRRGETLWAIAGYFKTTVTRIARANNIRDIHLIRVGQRLNIPDAGAAPGNKPRRSSSSNSGSGSTGTQALAFVPGPRPVSADENASLGRLKQLADAAGGAGANGAAFQGAVNLFQKMLRARLNSTSQGSALPADLGIVMRALLLWSQDPGNTWGEGIWDSDDLILSAPGYATVPASQYKCNAYVAEVIYQSLGKIFLVHASKEEKGKYFPYQAKEWGNKNVDIPNFKVVTAPAMGDVWSNGTHTGIYLGEYTGKKIYVSARDDLRGVFGLTMQKAHGIQIKYLSDGGVFRRYMP
ncbi:LysM peptidoglycan-binding domain-containing protein [Cystobacter fuscus]|uniref:LysM peptidoglycan-binding domain-containing protein n=1 Tax=Cystobacter fuscus TaxID=43 RepID=UPI002B2C629D|nr:LysM peptidoglycan-binding domain-containing protein [Cystobacter fuscus]